MEGKLTPFAIYTWGKREKLSPNQGKTDSVKIGRDRQGCCMSPTLFNLY